MHRSYSSKQRHARLNVEPAFARAGSDPTNSPSSPSASPALRRSIVEDSDRFIASLLALQQSQTSQAVRRKSSLPAPSSHHPQIIPSSQSMHASPANLQASRSSSLHIDAQSHHTLPIASAMHASPSHPHHAEKLHVTFNQSSLIRVQSADLTSAYVSSADLAAAIAHVPARQRSKDMEIVLQPSTPPSRRLRRSFALDVTGPEESSDVQEEAARASSGSPSINALGSHVGNVPAGAHGSPSTSPRLSRIVGETTSPRSSRTLHPDEVVFLSFLEALVEFLSPCYSRFSTFYFSLMIISFLFLFSFK